LPSDFLGDRRASLENAFFAEQDAALRRRMAQSESTKVKKAALSEASGIKDDAVLDTLLGAGVTGETLLAMSLVPLVAVAWADGSIDRKEHAAIMSAAESAGVDRASPNHELLNGWLAKKPSRELVNTWKQYVSALIGTMDEKSRQTLKDELLGRAETVAKAAGGFLGLTGGMSEEERQVLQDLRAAFEK